MPLIDDDLSSFADSPEANRVLGQENFSRGVISLIDESKLPKNALKQADNITLAEDGAPKVRPGIQWFGTNPSAFPIDGAEMFVMPDDTVHILIVAGGTIYRSTDDGATWSTCTGGSFTSGKKVRFEQANEFIYMFNGWDNIVRYSGILALAVYTAIGTPTANAATKGAGLTGATIYTYRYRVSAVNEIGYSIASTVVAGGLGVDRTRDQFNDTNYVSFTWATVTGAVRYDIFVGQSASNEVYIDSVEAPALAYLDKGFAIEQQAIVAPETNTTQGPRCGDMALIGTRLYATADRDFPYRVLISGAGRFVGQFSSAYDATYIDLQKGGQYKPIKVEDYRDGKGTPLATIWCKSKDGKGCIWQGGLESFTIGNITFPVPNFYRLPGSRGTDAPDSVVNVLNDYMYYNSQAFFNLGSRAQFLNLLSTDEASANIRPDVKKIRPSAAPGIAGHFQDAKVLFSVPYDSDVNNNTIIFDTERKAWLPKGFTVGFERFFSYTDNSAQKKRHLLCWKPGDTRLSEISEDFRGDYGVAFNTSIITGLIHVNTRNRFDFLWCEEAEFEFAQPRDPILVELSGITREDGFTKIDEKTIQPDTVKNSWTTDVWTSHKWTHKRGTAISYSEPSTKRFFNVQRDINAYQYRVTTNSINSDFILRTLQVNGSSSQAGKPREWELLD